jgi:mono/diheme cytochrome c family protein
MTLAERLPAIVITTILLLGVGSVAWRVVSPDDETVTVAVKVPQLSERAQEGKKAFDDDCAACHGTSAAGSDEGPPLVHDIYNPGHHTDASFFAAANRGVPRHHWNFGDMPPQPQVTDDDAAAIVRYIRELQEANGIFYRKHTM